MLGASAERRPNMTIAMPVHTVKNTILILNIIDQSSSFILQSSYFITQILLNIFENYNLTNLVNV